MKLLIKFFIYKKGFSLAEVIIALGILTFGLVGIASLLLQNMQVENLTKNYVIGSMLAQEGVELVRNIRDENWVLYQDWVDDIPDGSFALDYRGRASINLTPTTIGDAGTRLYLDGSNFYSHDTSLRATPFHRLITVDIYSDYMLVKADVMWSGRFGERHYIIETTLFNWRG
jgi:hypothetical protein